MLWIMLLTACLEVRATTVQVVAPPGGRAALPCQYEFEDEGPIEELSVQWKGPAHQLLCHFIKHKAFRNCTPGYELDYAPGRMLLVIRQVGAGDEGRHVCSASKRHKFSDYAFQLSLGPRSVTAAPETSGHAAGLPTRPIKVLTPFAMDCRNDDGTQPQDEDVMEIPLDDPEANKAAAKIQAGFRGHMTRKKLKDDKPREEVSSSGEADESAHEALNSGQSQSEAAGPEVAEADDTPAPEH